LSCIFLLHRYQKVIIRASLADFRDLVGNFLFTYFHLPNHPLKARPALEHFPLQATAYLEDSRIA
jgi:hypothetical protein